MPKKVSLEISDKTYENLLALATRLGQDEKEVATAILEAISSSDYDIERLSKMPCVDTDLKSVLCEALENYPIFAGSTRNFLVKLKAEGEFRLDAENVEWDLEKDFFSANFDVCSENYRFAWINVRKEDGRYNLGTYMSVNIEETKNGSFDDLVEVAESADCPFYVEDYRVDVDSDEETCNLAVEYWADSLEDLPILKEADRFIKQILKKAKVTLKQ